MLVEKYARPPSTWGSICNRRKPLLGHHRPFKTIMPPQMGGQYMGGNPPTIMPPQITISVNQQLLYLDGFGDR